MWGFGGRYYWRKRGGDGGSRREGIVVAFAWMSSEERHLRNYVELYSSCGWDSLVCHSQFLNMFFPAKAAIIASDIVNELVKELKDDPCPVVFSSFSGGPKACMYKVLQILDGTCESKLESDDCRLVRSCIAGYIYDSSPVDFTSDLGTRFAIHPSIIKLSHPPKPAIWVANSIASGLDHLFLERFESQRAEYWQTLYASISMVAPYLILCSEDDDLAPYQIINNFAERLKDLGADVKFVKWINSPHVGHFRHHQDEYKAAVSDLLTKAATLHSQRTQKLIGETPTGSETIHENYEISKPIPDLRQAAASDMHQSFNGIPLVTTDHFLLPNSLEYYEGRNAGPMQSEDKQGLIHLHSLKTDVDPNGVLGQILFDVCIPKNVEDWDLGLPGSGSSLGLSKMKKKMRKKGLVQFNPAKCIRRSRL